MFGIRYIGNTHIPHYKETAALASIDMPAPASVLLPMVQHIGAPATPIVNPGDSVKIGQKIAEASGYVSSPIFAPISGKIEKNSFAPTVRRCRLYVSPQTVKCRFTKVFSRKI